MKTWAERILRSTAVDSGGSVRGDAEWRTGAPRRRHDHANEQGESTMPQYLLSVWHDDDYGDVDFTSPEMQAIGERVGAVNAELEQAGAWVFGAGLRPASSATVVRATGDGVSMTDGPYAETKEQMGGFWIIQAPDFDKALEWAGKATAACELPVEVRPTEDV